MRPRPRIAISQGDPNGIGPEVVLKALADARIMRFMQPVIVGSPDLFRRTAAIAGVEADRIIAVSDPNETVDSPGIPVWDPMPEITARPEPGAIRADAGRVSMLAVEHGVRLCMEGVCAALVTAPISKEAIALAGYKEPGHTDYLKRITGAEQVTMMLVADALRVALVTTHIALREVAGALNVDAILRRIRVLDRSLRIDFGISRPRIAMLGLNPHAGDGGVMGDEEARIIQPAIDAANGEGFLVTGPYPADGYFATRNPGYDAVLAMYHDQGLVPFKALAFERGVNFTAGLPIVRTSPDHGTAFNIAGEGNAHPGSMQAALYCAIDIARRRA